MKTTKASDTELGRRAIAELDAIKAEMAREGLTLKEKFALQERGVSFRVRAAAWKADTQATGIAEV